MKPTTTNTTSTTPFDTARHPIDDDGYIATCRNRLNRDGALVLPGFVRSEVIDGIVAESAGRRTFGPSELISVCTTF